MGENNFNIDNFREQLATANWKNIDKLIKVVSSVSGELSTKINEILFEKLAEEKACGIKPEESISRTLLIAKNRRLIGFVLNKYLPYSGNTDYEDLSTCGLIALVNSIDNFNPNFGTKFSTYACTYILTAINNEIKMRDTTLENAVSFDTPIHQAKGCNDLYLIDILADDNEDFYIAKESVEDLRAKLSDSLKYLSPREQITIIARLTGSTQEQLSNYLEVSRTTIDKITNEVKRKLRVLHTNINELPPNEKVLIQRITKTTYPVIPQKEYKAILQAIKLGKTIHTDEANTSLTTGRNCALPDKEKVKKYLSYIQYFNYNEQLIMSLYLGVNRSTNVKPEDIAKLLNIEKHQLYHIAQYCERKLNLLSTPPHRLATIRKEHYDFMKSTNYNVLSPAQLEAMLNEIHNGKRFIFTFEHINPYNQKLEKIGGVDAVNKFLKYLSPTEQVIVQSAFSMNGIEFMQQKQLAQLTGYNQSAISSKFRSICEGIRILNSNPEHLTDVEQKIINNFCKKTYSVLSKEELNSFIEELRIKNGYKITEQENL